MTRPDPRPTEVVPAAGRADTEAGTAQESGPSGLERLFPRSEPGHLGRLRTSTVVLIALFAAVFTLWVLVRPPTPQTTGSTTPAVESTVEQPPPATEAPSPTEAPATTTTEDDEPATPAPTTTVRPTTSAPAPTTTEDDAPTEAPAPTTQAPPPTVTEAPAPSEAPATPTT